MAADLSKAKNLDESAEIMMHDACMFYTYHVTVKGMSYTAVWAMMEADGRLPQESSPWRAKYADCSAETMNRAIASYKPEPEITDDSDLRR